MKRLVLILIFAMTGWMTSWCQSVDIHKATEAVSLKLKQLNCTCFIVDHEVIHGDNGVDFYLFHLDPVGYMIVPASMELPMVLAYSLTSQADPEGWLMNVVANDLSSRMLYQPEAAKVHNREAWSKLGQTQGKSALFQQWPEPGTTPTGGWLSTNWTQNAPYNLLCPMDPVTGVRSIAGCPAVAMAQIVNFHQTTNGVHFTDEDDYHHVYAGRNYMIDDDYSTIDFPSFPVLNGYLDTLQISYQNGTELNNRDKAALTFACGVAAHQVYTSSASGTFGVDQAAAAYLKFNFDQVVLLTDQDTNFYNHMAQNIKDTLPVHLAVVDPAWSMGHNVVVDGYNTDEYFHLNFGWGGSNNGWYLLPEEIPYGLTVIEGAILDIIPDHTTEIFEQRRVSSLVFPNPADRVLNVVNTREIIKKVTFYAMDGRLIRTVAIDDEKGAIDVSGMSNGLYLISVSGKSFTETELVFVNH